MEHVVAGIVAVAQAHALLAYSLALALAGAESFPVFGALVPGTATIVALGALVPSGALQFWPLVLATTVGAILGDGFSYWLGHRYKAGVAAIWPLRRHPGLIAQGEAFFVRHGGKAIVVARFTPGVRAVVPLVAGIAEMQVVRFYGMNVLSAVLWAPSHVMMGVLIGASLTVLGAIAGRLAALVFSAFLVLALLVWLTPRAVRLLTNQAARLRAPVHVWAISQDTWFRRQVLAVVDPTRPELEGLLTLGVALIAGIWVFLGVLQDVLSGDPLVRADRAVFQLLQSLRVAVFDWVAVAVTELGDASVTIAVASVALLWLVWHRAWRTVYYSVAAVAGGTMFALLLKATLRQARPADLYAGWSAFSFPSSHTTVSTVLYGFLAVLIGREVGMRWRIAAVLAAVLLVSSIAFSRLYLGAHWLSDVVAGFAFGLAWIALLGIAYLQHAPQRLHAGGLVAVVGIALFGAGTAHISLAHGADMRRYAVQMPTRTMMLTSWQVGEWAELPARRIDLLGEYEEPFTIQWAGSLDDLRATLSAAGWTAPVPWTLRSSVEWLSPQAGPASLPVLPRLDGGRAEALVMVKTGGSVPADQRLVLRLWRSDVVLSTGSASLPLWIGTVVAERIKPVAALIAIATERPNMDFPLRLLHEALPSVQVGHRPEVMDDVHWNGIVILGQS